MEGLLEKIFLPEKYRMKPHTSIWTFRLKIAKVPTQCPDTTELLSQPPKSTLFVVLIMWGKK